MYDTPNIHEQKIAPTLREHLTALQDASNMAEVRFIGDCGVPVDDKICQIIARRGIQIVAVTGNRFIAKGNVDQINMLSRMSLVSELQLSISHHNLQK